MHTRFDVAPRPTLAELVSMARAGQLAHPDGGDVAPFDLPQATAARYTQQERNRRLGRKPKHSSEVSDAVEAARLARVEAWGIVQQDMRQIRNLAKARTAQIEARQQALAVVLKNVAVLQKLEPEQQEPASNAQTGDAPALDAEHTQPPSAAERLAAQARAEPSTLGEHTNATGATEP